MRQREGLTRMSDTSENAGALFRAGKLDQAIAAANADVRRRPGDLGCRILLAELLVFSGNLERADLILDAASRTDPTSAVVIAEFRQLLRAETARRQVSREGRVPEFLGEPTAALQAALAARMALRAGDAAEAARHTAAIEAARPRTQGELTSDAGKVSFDDFRDVDDLCAGFFEVLTTTGKYYWIPTERVASIAFHPPRRPRDLAWRRATMSVNSGPDGEVYLPAIYDSLRPDLSDDYRLGSASDWSGEEEGPPVKGIGRRVFLAGDEAYSIMDLFELRFGP
jgi:type VI secretion system protein ImpE